MVGFIGASLTELSSIDESQKTGRGLGETEGIIAFSVVREESGEVGVLLNWTSSRKTFSRQELSRV